jgi:hypothetical protein
MPTSKNGPARRTNSPRITKKGIKNNDTPETDGAVFVARSRFQRKTPKRVFRRIERSAPLLKYSVSCNEGDLGQPSVIGRTSTDSAKDRNGIEQSRRADYSPFLCDVNSILPSDMDSLPVEIETASHRSISIVRLYGASRR